MHEIEGVFPIKCTEFHKSNPLLYFYPFYFVEIGKKIKSDKKNKKKCLSLCPRSTDHR